MKPFLLYPRSFQNSVVSLTEVHKAGIAALLVAHKERCGAEVALLVQIPYRLLCGPVQGHESSAKLNSCASLVAVLVLPTFTSLSDSKSDYYPSSRMALLRLSR